MNFGILGPYMSGTDRDRLLAWFRRVDAGPFSTIATGERELWPQIEQHAFLAAAAAVTTRVRVMSHVMIVPMHPPVLLAKRLASIDVIAGGRLVVGIGTGGRAEDYRAAGSTRERPWQRIDDAVATMRRVWAGEPPWDGAPAPVGPPPTRSGGPPLYTGASGPKALARAARWADGWQGAVMSADVATMREQVERHLGAWERAGRSERPYLMNSRWFALGDRARERLDEVTARYLGLPPGTASPLGRTPYDADGIRRAVDNCRQVGFDELVFIPISDDIEQLDLLESVLERL